jgi:outer membrane protein TolC
MLSRGFNRLRVLVASALIVSFSQTALADHKVLPPPGSETMTLQSLIEEAKENNAELRAMRAEANAREAQIGPRGSYDDPMLGVEAMNYPVDTFRADRYSMTGVQLSLSQRVPFPGKLSRLKDSARHDFEAANLAVKAKELMVTKDIRTLYYALFAAYKKKDLLAEQNKVLNQVIAVTRNKYALSKVPQADVLNLQVEDATLTDQVLSVDKNIKLILGEMNHMLGRSSHENFVYSRPENVERAPFDFSTFTEHVVFEMALANNPALKGRVAEVQASEEKVRYANWNYLPDFSFKVGYTFRQPNAMDNGTDFVSGMVGITLPIWAGTKQSEEKKEAQAQRVKAEALRDDEKNRLAHEVHATYAELEEARDRIKLYESGVLPLVRESLASAQSGYATGKVQYSTLLNLINRRYQTETSYYEAVANFDSRIAELEAMTGDKLGGSQ